MLSLDIALLSVYFDLAWWCSSYEVLSFWVPLYWQCLSSSARWYGLYGVDAVYVALSVTALIRTMLCGYQDVLLATASWHAVDIKFLWGRYRCFLSWISPPPKQKKKRKTSSQRTFISLIKYGSKCVHTTQSLTWPKKCAASKHGWQDVLVSNMHLSNAPV